MRRMLIILTLVLMTGLEVFGAIGAGDPDPYVSDSGESSKTEVLDPFIEILTGKKTGVFIGDWLNVEGESFAFSLPAGFSVKFFTDNYEIADIIFYGGVVSKIIVGYVYESEPVIETINKVADDYLYNLGDYSITESLSKSVADGTISEIYSLDFSGIPCWFVLNSQSKTPGEFGPGRFFIFLGLPDEMEMELWASLYSGIVQSVSLF